MKDFLQEQFDAKPQRAPKQSRDIMKGKRKADGGAYFSFSQCGKVQKYAQIALEYAAWPGCSMCGKKPCELFHGRVLSEEEIKPYNSGLAQKRKQDDKNHGMLKYHRIARRRMLVPRRRLPRRRRRNQQNATSRQLPRTRRPLQERVSERNRCLHVHNKL